MTLLRDAHLAEHEDADSEVLGLLQTDGRLKALRWLDEAIALDPGLQEARMHRAVLRAELGMAEAARADVAELEESGAGWEALAWVRRRADGGPFAFVCPSTETWEPREDGSVVDAYYAARGFQRQGLRQEALALLVRCSADALYRTPADVIAGICHATGGKRDYVAAIRAYDRARAHAPEHPVITNNLVTSLIYQCRQDEGAMDKCEEAVGLIEAACARERGIPMLWTTRAMVMAEMGRGEFEIREALETGLARFPGDVRITVSWAQTFVVEAAGIVAGGGDVGPLLQPVLAALYGTLDRAPEWGPLAYTLGACHYSAGDDAEAMRWMRRALELGLINNRMEANAELVLDHLTPDED